MTHIYRTELLPAVADLRNAPCAHISERTWREETRSESIEDAGFDNDSLVR